MSRALFVLFTLLLARGLVQAQPTTTRVSIDPGGSQGNGASESPVISADGRWIAFASAASNLVPDDTNGRRDVFVHDRQTGTTTRVSLASGGVQANHDSSEPAVSADGRWVAFFSLASNLVTGDTNGFGDVFVHDRQGGTTTRVSVASGGLQGNGASYTPAISADGRWVGFLSYATNLVPGDTNRRDDAFLRDRQTGVTTRVSLGVTGFQGNGDTYAVSMSADARWVAFESNARDLVLGDSNGVEDIFLRDRLTGTTTRISVGPGGIQGNSYSFAPTISADGLRVAFWSHASNLVPGDTNGAPDVFVHDRQTGVTTGVSVGPGGIQGDGPSLSPTISADGRWIAFESDASTLTEGDTNGVGDAFVHDGLTGRTARVSVDSGGRQGRNLSARPVMSADGRLIVFHSIAPDLVPGDTNGVSDVFVHDRGESGCVTAVTPASTSAPTGGASGSAEIVAPAGCAWSAVSTEPDWLTLTGGTSGDGNGALDYTVSANAGPPRSGTIAVGWHYFRVHQSSDTTPAAPTGLVAHAVTGNVVTLRWTIPPGGVAPSGFVLEGGLHPGEVLASLPTGSGNPTFTFTAPTGTFYVRVHALSGTVRSAASNELRIHPNVPVPPAGPTSLLAMVSGSTLALAWTNTYTGGAPTSFLLDVTGALTTTLPLPFGDSLGFAGVPNGTYTLTLRARGMRGFSPPSNPVTVTFPGPCSGPPLTPTNLLAYRVGNTVFVDWTPAESGPAPTAYLLNVTGSFVGSFPTAARAMSGTVGAGTYTLSVAATNACGASAATAPQTVVVP
ncbi:MAG TPA: hypothetical protein VMO26_07780 [Vicinamibacterales bacterium]|nr:hypothetical protein [Vicinamibacterales bacterium]